MGELVHADEDRNAELLWAARGAGPGFPGVVTRFHIVLQPLPRAITTSTYVYALSELDAVAEWASEVVSSLRPTVELTLLIAPAPTDVEAGPEGRALIVTATRDGLTWKGHWLGSRRRLCLGVLVGGFNGRGFVRLRDRLPAYLTTRGVPEARVCSWRGRPGGLPA